MMAASWLGVLVLLGASGGSFPGDLVSLLDAEAYFQSRKVEVTAAQMAALAAKDPADPKTQIGQLLALRWLGEHPDAVQKDAKIRALLDAVAAGKQAQDPHGFARDYAKRALARLDGKPAPVVPMADNSLRDGIAWFPSGVALVAGIENRGPPVGPGIDLKAITAMFNQMMPAEAREEMYKFAEDVGNVEVSRFTFAYAVDPNERQNDRIYMRFTGRGNRKRLADNFISDMIGTVKEEKGPKGEPLTILTPGKNGPAVALIGDTEMIMAGHTNVRDAAKQADVLREVLDVRAGRLAGVGKGAWEARLKEVPAKAKAFYVGEVPEDMRKDLTRGTPFKEMPSFLVADIVQDKDLVVRVRGTFGSAADAKAFGEAAEQLKQMGLMALTNLPPEVKIRPKGLEALSKTLEGIKVEPKEAVAVGELRVPADRLPVLAGVVEDLLKSFAEEKKR